MKIEELESYIYKNTVEQILTNALNNFLCTKEQDNEKLITKFYEEPFKEITNDFNYFKESVKDLKANWKEYRWLYNMLNDEESKETLLGMIEAKLMMDPRCIEKVFSDDTMYFDEKIFGHFENEVYVDCGAYIGDSVIKFIEMCPQYQKIYAFEAIPQIAERCKENLKYFIEKKRNIEVLEYAVSDSSKEIYFDIGTLHGDSREISNGKLKVKAVALDNIIKGNVTFLKMDIEGGEKNALEGSKNLIKEYNPKIAVCIYHLKDDFWKIPQQILSINPDYILKIRQHDLEVYSETVLYCIPKSKNNLQNVRNYKRIAENLQEAQKQLVFYTEQENKNLLQHVKDKKWFLKQLRNYKNDCQRKDKDIENLKEYIHTLEEGKSWLENQVQNYKSDQEKLKVYIEELIKGKDWLEGQLKNYKNDIQNLNIEVKKKTMSETKYEEEICILKNELAKTEYKLNMLKNDGLIKKIILLKKYDI